MKLNPSSWDYIDKTVVGISAGIGAALGLVLGYFVLAVGSGAEGAVGFKYWATYRLSQPFGWVVFGAVIGAAIAIAARLRR